LLEDSFFFLFVVLGLFAQFKLADRQLRLALKDLSELKSFDFRKKN
jgi:hypothetical protein